MVYLPKQIRSTRLVWVDLKGNETGDVSLPGNRGTLGQPRISPDARRILVRLQDSTGAGLFNYSFDTGVLTKLHNNVLASLWSVDAEQIFYSRMDARSVTLIRRNGDGTGPEEVLIDDHRAQFATSLSRKGDVVFYWDCIASLGDCDIGRLTLADKPSAKPMLATEFREAHGALSPDERWFAYQSNRSGRTEVYVRPYPDIDSARWQVSTGGGSFPVWSPEGDTLYFAGGLGPSREMMAATIAPERTFSASAPQRLFTFTSTLLPDVVRNFDLHPDGDRFLLAVQDDGPGQRLVYVQNWLDEIERLAPIEL